MKEIYLNYPYLPTVITDEAYAMIVQIVEENRICQHCKGRYTDTNLRVLLNKCLGCFLESHPTILTFAGLLSDEIYDYERYKFLDQQGNAWVSYSNSYNRVVKDNYTTLRHHGFPVPETYAKEGKERVLQHIYWKMHGNFTENAVIVIEFSEHLQLAFLSYKDGSLVEIHRRKTVFKKLFQRAKERAESTKDINGEYHIGNNSSHRLNDSDLYTLLSEILTEEYHASHYQGEERAFRNPQKALQ